MEKPVKYLNVKPENATEPLFYQGIGYLSGTLQFIEKNKTFTLTTKYDVIEGMQTSKHNLINYVTLIRQCKKHPNDKIWLKLQPEFYSKTNTFKFIIVGFDKVKDNKIIENYFLLKGIYQKLYIKDKVTKDVIIDRSVFSIYRNNKKNEKDIIKTNHLPIKGLNVKPFIFDNRLDKQVKQIPLFYEILANYDHDEKIFICSQILNIYNNPPQKYKVFKAKKVFKKPESKLPKPIINKNDTQNNRPNITLPKPTKNFNPPVLQSTTKKYDIYGNS